ncbi:MAG: alpha/beta hydrolase, partial [Betaproteobacteria bacterium HGW-Betaproteobacteria-21]
MSFDARAIKLLQPGQHLTSPDYPGLRMESSQQYRSWIYRYKSPVDGRMRQVLLGRWPGMSSAAAIGEWERVRSARDNGADPAAEARQARVSARQQAERDRQAKAITAYRVRDLCDDYLSGHIDKHRKSKGAAEVCRTFATMLGSFGELPAAEVTRAQAFDLIKGYADRIPVQAGNLRSELGSAWDYAVDSGRLPESVPNWWRLILRGKIRSKGKRIAGEHVGTAKRVLAAEEMGMLIRWLPNFTALIEDVLATYLWTGTRGAEIVAMEGKEVREEGDGILWWTIPKAKTKSARHENAGDLRVPLFGRARAVALRRMDLYGDGWLYPNKTRDGRLSHTQQKVIQESVYSRQPYCQIRPEWERSRLPVTHWSPHDLRRSARTLLTAMGCPSEVAEAVL